MAETDDLRAFIRDLMTRFDRKMDRIDATVERQAAENRAHLRELHERTEELLAERRAGREALFRILDRLDGRGGPAVG